MLLDHKILELALLVLRFRSLRLPVQSTQPNLTQIRAPKLFYLFIPRSLQLLT